MDRDDEVGVTYQIISPFGDETPLQTIMTGCGAATYL